MKIFFVLAYTATFLTTQGFAQSEADTKQKTPAEVSAESADEEPDEQGMEKEESDTRVNDKSSSAKSLGLDANPLGNKKSNGDDATTNQLEEMDEAADDILDQSFSQPGVDQNTGHVKKNRSGGAKVAVPKKSAPIHTEGLGKKHKPVKSDVEEKNKPVVITDKNIIKKIQKALIKKGAKISVDGVMGESTIDAIKTFQSEHDLTPDGSPGPSTMAKLGIVYIQK